MKYIIEEYGGGLVCLLLGSAIIRVLQEVITIISCY